MLVQPYLSFDGRCEEAVEFYRSKLGARVVTLSRFKEAPDQSMMPPGTGEKIMHGELRLGDSVLLVSDGMCTGSPKFEGISLALTAKDIPEAERFFNALADGGQVQMPLTETFFSPRFGMLADRFGVKWMLVVATS